MGETRLMRRRDGRLVEDHVVDITYDRPWLVAPAYPDVVGRTGLTRPHDGGRRRRAASHGRPGVPGPRRGHPVDSRREGRP
jgi:hypothetical protein